MQAGDSGGTEKEGAGFGEWLHLGEDTKVVRIADYEKQSSAEKEHETSS